LESFIFSSGFCDYMKDIFSPSIYSLVGLVCELVKIFGNSFGLVRSGQLESIKNAKEGLMSRSSNTMYALLELIL